MPNSFQRNLAVNQTEPTEAIPGLSKDRPWEYTFTAGQAPQGVLSRPVGDRSGMHYGSGPQGAGYYDLNSPGAVNLAAQKNYLDQFKHDMPEMGNKMFGMLAEQGNQQLGSQIESLRSTNSARGLLYGGINAGQEGAARAQEAGSLASGRSQINKGLIDSYNQMAASRIDAGIKFQQQQQSIQDAIYQDALRSFAANSGMISNVFGAAGAIVGGIYAGPGGAVAGYEGGKAVGSAI